MSYPCRYKRVCLLALTLSFCFLLSSCAYVRLLQFKNQLSDFERFVTVEKSDGLAFVFKKPVLKSKDFVFITRSQPTRIISDPEDSSSAKWIWRFEKDSDHSSKDPYAISFATTFRDGVLERMEVDDSLLEAMDADFIVMMLESLGDANVDTLKKAARAEMNREQAASIRFPNLIAIEKVLGKPTRVRAKKKESAFENEYVFNFRNPNNQAIAGQFKVIFQTETDLDPSISGFVLSGRAR